MTAIFERIQELAQDAEMYFTVHDDKAAESCLENIEAALMEARGLMED